MTQKKKGIAGAFGGNLLSNAIKFTRSGTVTLSTGYKNGIFTLTVEDTGHGMYVRKALSFVRKMQRHLSASHIQIPPLHQQSTPDNHHKMARPSTVLRWTGKASDLVELIYGVSEMGCINGGEASLKEIAAYFYKVFGVQAKGCYNIFGDIKMRKNESRTYFLDRAAEKVNRRMLLDEERERMRR